MLEISDDEIVVTAICINPNIAEGIITPADINEYSTAEKPNLI
ncbi:hypothetical protein DR79_2106 [Francisella tularensis]|nr:hypothetical protein DR79_2106 [Francisella tularensis]